MSSSSSSQKMGGLTAFFIVCFLGRYPCLIKLV